jgi:TonB-linked SusC/RagA family outer membrane protein
MQHTPSRFAIVVLSALLALPALAAAQGPVTITGRVTTDAGVPLGGVEVAIPTMGLGGQSRDDGRYSIVVPGARVAGQTVMVVARLLGYRSMSAQVALVPGATQDFSLRANPLQLGEIVVTGAGTLSATEKLGSVRNNVASDLIARAGELNVVQALAGKAPNVTVIQQSGDPGAGSFINIRGISSILGANQPLFIVDGQPIDNSTFSTSNFNASDDGGGTLGQFGQTEGTVATNRAADLNPNDIESIEILKGPAASAIYGARAAAGVVLITTKSGRPGATRFTYRSSLAFNDLNRTYPLQRSWTQGRFGAQPDTSLGGACDNIASATCVRSWGVQIPAGAPVFDHANDIYRVGQTFENGFTISGGSDRTTFYLSGDRSVQEGVFVGPNNRYSRSTVRVKATHRIMDNLEIGANVAFADSRGRFIQRGNNTNGVQLGNLRSPPEYDNRQFKTPTGQQITYRFRHPNDATLREDRGFDNPYWVLNEQRNTSEVGRVIGNVSAEYVPISWLKLNYILGADYANDERLEACPVGSSSPCNEGRMIDGKIISYQINHNLTGTASYTLNPNVSGTVTVGQALNARNLRQLGTVGRTMVAVLPFKLSNTVSQDLPIDAEQVIHNASWFGQATVDLWSQLYLTVAARNDGSSTFGRDNLRTWFPKGSAAWEFSKQTGQRLSWLSFGKARLAYGEAGQEPLPYLTVQTFSSGLIGGISQGTGNTPTQNGIGGLASNLIQAAASLKPERSREFEAGVDVGLFNDRADASITWYNKKSEDVILLEPLAPSTGFFQRAANAASFRNRGWEVSLNVRPIRTADYGWDVGFQWARNRNRVLSVGDRDFIPVGAQFVNQVAMVGQPLGVGLLIGWLR